MGWRASERTLLACVLVVATVVLLPTLWNGFVYDDLFVFIGSERVHEIGNVPAFFAHNAMYVTEHTDPLAVDTYRPLTLTTFAIDSLWSGKKPFGYHLSNLLIHLACIVLVFRVATRVLTEPSRRFAWVAAAWFGLSPWIGEAYIWINGRSDPLCTLFALAALLVWDRGLVSGSARSKALASLLFFASLLCKEVALGILPAMLFWPRFEGGDATWKARTVAIAGPIAAATAYLGIRVSVLGGFGANAGAQDLIASASHFGLLFFDSVRALLVPSPPFLRLLAEPYLATAPVVRWALTAAALLLVGTVIVFRRRQPALAWSTVFFTATLAPAVAVTVLVWPGFGRYLYLPFAGLCIGLVDACARGLYRVGALEGPRARRIIGGLVAGYLALNAILLQGFTFDFRNDGTLYGSVIEHAPDQAYGYAYAGLSLVNVGKPKEALGYLEKALRLQPNEPKYRVFYGEALIRAGRERDTVRLAEAWLKTSRGADAPQYLMLIVNAAERDDPARALAAGRACAQRFPQYGRCLAAVARIEHTLDPKGGSMGAVGAPEPPR